jgi:hypothetical protein
MTKGWVGFQVAGAACADSLKVKSRGQECPRHMSYVLRWRLFLLSLNVGVVYPMWVLRVLQ